MKEKIKEIFKLITLGKIVKLSIILTMLLFIFSFFYPYLLFWVKLKLCLRQAWWNFEQVRERDYEYIWKEYRTINGERNDKAPLKEGVVKEESLEAFLDELHQTLIRAESAYGKERNECFKKYESPLHILLEQYTPLINKK